MIQTDYKQEVRLMSCHLFRDIYIFVNDALACFYCKTNVRMPHNHDAAKNVIKLYNYFRVYSLWGSSGFC